MIKIVWIYICILFFLEYDIRESKKKGYLISIRLWRYSSSSSPFSCSWQTPWKNKVQHSVTKTFLPRPRGLGTVTILTELQGYSNNNNIIQRTEHTSSDLTMNLVSPLDRVSVTKPIDSKWSTTAWRSLGLGGGQKEKGKGQNITRQMVKWALIIQQDDWALVGEKEQKHTCFVVWEVKFGWVNKISISPLDAAPGNDGWISQFETPTHM